MPLFTATVATLAGDADRAERLLRTVLRADDRTGSTALDAAVSRDLARILLDRGLWAEAHDLTDWLSPAAQPDPDRQPAPSEAADQLGIRSWIEALRGNGDLAADLAVRAGADAAHTDSPLSRGVAALDLAHVLALTANADGARAAALAAGAWFEQKQDRAGVGRARELARQMGLR